jgi:hypothetical protein
MAHSRWRREGTVSVDLPALETLLLRVQFKLANVDLSSGYAFALPQPGKKYDDRMMSILISWSPRRLDGYMVEIRSNEPKGKSNHTCDKLAKLIVDELIAVMGC